MKGMQVLNLIHKFELLHMRDNLAIKDYSSKILLIANKVQLLGNAFPDSHIIKKILVSILEKYEVVITTLENTWDFLKIMLSKLIHALQAQDQR
jgi:hypothetical protein